MTRITEILEAVEGSDLSDEQVGEFYAELQTLFADIREGKVEDVASTDLETLRLIVETTELLAVAAAARFEAAEKVDAEIAALEARLAVEASDEEPEEAPAEEEAEEGEPTEDEVAEVVAEAEAVLAEEPEPVTAAAPPSLGEIAKAAPARTRPRQAPAAPKYTIQGQTGPLADMGAVANELADAWNSGVTSSYGDQVRVARVNFAYPEDRVLRNMDGDDVAEKIEAVVASGQDPSSWNDSVVASGGWCAPTDVDYTILQTAGNQRPVTASLPRFQATRGGIRVAPAMPPFFPSGAAQVSYDASDPTVPVTVWDSDTDADPDGDTKGVGTIECPEFSEYFTQAIVKRQRFSNFSARAFPENVQAYTEFAMAAHAHAAETILLDGIKGASTQVTVPQTFGAARDIAEAIKRAATGYRSRHRNSGVTLRALVPSWVTTLGDIDLMRGLQSDPSFVRDGEAIFRSMLSVAGVNVTFYEDTPTTGVSQVFGTQGAGVLNPFPTQVQWGLYDEGHFLFLDGGTLDLGIVRDATLNSTNDYETFVETFEGLAPRGSEALWITSAVCADGTSSAGVESAVVCES